MTEEFLTMKLIPGLRECAQKYNKVNFYIPAEITTGIDHGALYLGKGQRLADSANISGAGLDPFRFKRNSNVSGADGTAFHYSIYRAFLATAGLQGQLLAPFDVDSDIILDWNIFVDKVDYFNANTGKYDPR